MSLSDLRQSRLAQAYKGKARLEALAGSTDAELVELDSTLLALRDERLLSSAVGVQLDTLGRLVGITREYVDSGGTLVVEDDDTYRDSIRARIRASISNGTTDDILQTLSQWPIGPAAAGVGSNPVYAPSSASGASVTVRSATPSILSTLGGPGDPTESPFDWQAVTAVYGAGESWALGVVPGPGDAVGRTTVPATPGPGLEGTVLVVRVDAGALFIVSDVEGQNGRNPYGPLAYPFHLALWNDVNELNVYGLALEKYADASHDYFVVGVYHDEGAGTVANLKAYAAGDGLRVTTDRPGYAVDRAERTPSRSARFLRQVRPAGVNINFRHVPDLGGGGLAMRLDTAGRGLAGLARKAAVGRAVLDGVEPSSGVFFSPVSGRRFEAQGLPTSDGAIPISSYATGQTVFPGQLRIASSGRVYVCITFIDITATEPESAPASLGDPQGAEDDGSGQWLYTGVTSTPGVATQSEWYYDEVAQFAEDIGQLGAQPDPYDVLQSVSHPGRVAIVIGTIPARNQMQNSTAGSMTSGERFILYEGLDRPVTLTGFDEGGGVYTLNILVQFPTARAIKRVGISHQLTGLSFPQIAPLAADNLSLSSGLVVPVGFVPITGTPSYVDIPSPPTRVVWGMQLRHFSASPGTSFVVSRMYLSLQTEAEIEAEIIRGKLSSVIAIK